MEDRHRGEEARDDEIEQTAAMPDPSDRGIPDHDEGSLDERRAHSGEDDDATDTPSIDSVFRGGQ